jgi:hypothetical protein
MFMKKQPEYNEQDKSMMPMNVGSDKLSRILLIGAIIVYSLSLVLLANLALAGEANETHGALIKVNNRLDGDAFSDASATVKSVNGNVLALNINSMNYAKLRSVEGVCAAYRDNAGKAKTILDAKSYKTKFAGANVVVGILDNSGILTADGITQMMKVESEANVGFISYLSDEPGSTVIMRNLKSGESNLVQALAYMQEYAKTVNKPLVIEMVISGKEMENQLFVQVCQKVAESGVQFLGEPGIMYGNAASQAPVQLAFSMFNTKTGQITDQSDFWTISEVKEQQIMLLGSDNNTCDIFFQAESGFEKVFLSNSSDDIVVVTALTSNGEVSYYHVINKESALIPRELMNGVPVLEDGLAGIYPYYSKRAMSTEGAAKNQFVALNKENQGIALCTPSEMALEIGSPTSGTLSMSLSNLDERVEIQIRNENGEIVYRNHPDSDTQSFKAKINLSEGAEGLYFLDLTSPEFQQSFALRMN